MTCEIHHEPEPGQHRSPHARFLLICRFGVQAPGGAPVLTWGFTLSGSLSNGIDYAYRDTGGHDGAVPLVLLQHFRGNLDSWDPALVDALARFRRVITFDNAGVGGSAGMTATRSSRWRGTRSPSSPRSGSAR